MTMTTTTTPASEDGSVDAAPDGGWQAWLFVAASWQIELMVWGVAYAYGALQDYHTHNPQSPFYGSSVTALDSVGTLVFAFQHLVPLLTYGFFSSYPDLIKRIACVCVALSALCLVVVSFIKTVGLLVVFQGALFGLVGGFLFIPVILWLPQWFDRRRGLATGMILSGSGIGGVIFPLIFDALLTSVGFRWTLRIWALIHFVLTGSAVAFLRPRIAPVRPTTPFKLRSLFPPSVLFLFQRRFLLYIAVIIFQAMGYYTMSLYISSYTSAHGFGASSATVVLAIFNAFATLGYVTQGSLGDRVPYTLVMTGSMTVCGLSALLVFGFAQTLPLILVFAILYGFGGGGFASHFTPIARAISSRCGAERVPFGQAYFTSMAVRSIACVAGPLVASALYPGGGGGKDDDTKTTPGGMKKGYGEGGYVGMIVFVGATSLLTATASLLIYWLDRKDTKKFLQQRREQEGQKEEKNKRKGYETACSIATVTPGKS